MLKPLVIPPLPLVFLLPKPRISRLAPVAGGRRDGAFWPFMLALGAVGIWALPKPKLPTRPNEAFVTLLVNGTRGC